MTRRQPVARTAGQIATLIVVFTGSVIGLAAAIVLVAPALLGGHAYVIQSNSMAPALRRGHIVITTTQRPAFRGDVAVFRLDDGPTITHRLVGRDRAGRWLTKGDANPERDSTPIPQDQIEGIGDLVVPYAGLPAIWEGVYSRRDITIIAVLLIVLACIPVRAPRARRCTSLAKAA